MCSIASETILRSVIAAKVANNEAFTAFDVTMQAKKRGMNERHREVKNTIHDIVLDEYPLYNRALVDVGAPVQAFLYFPTGYDIDDYVPMDRLDSFQTVTTPAPAPTPAINQNDSWLNDDDGDGWSTDDDYDEDDDVLW